MPKKKTPKTSQEQLEDIEDARAGEAIMRRVRAGEEEIVSLDEWGRKFENTENRKHRKAQL